MAVQPGDPEAMHLYQLIGAPLLAVVQAEAQAAQVSAEYIQRTGFDQPEGVDESDTGAQGAKKDLLHNAGNLKNRVELGPVKMATFSVERPDSSGQVRTHEISIPVLSLFPIPLLQVKDAEFSFSIRVLTRVPLESERDDTQRSRPQTAEDFLSSQRVELKGMLAPHGTEGERQSEMNINVKVRIEQSDMPAGLMKLLNLMDGSTKSQPRELKEDGK